MLLVVVYLCFVSFFAIDTLTKMAGCKDDFRQCVEIHKLELSRKSDHIRLSNLDSFHFFKILMCATFDTVTAPNKECLHSPCCVTRTRQGLWERQQGYMVSYKGIQCSFLASFLLRPFFVPSSFLLRSDLEIVPKPYPHHNRPCLVISGVIKNADILH